MVLLVPVALGLIGLLSHRHEAPVAAPASDSTGSGFWGIKEDEKAAAAEKRRCKTQAELQSLWAKVRAREVYAACHSWMGKPTPFDSDCLEVFRPEWLAGEQDADDEETEQNNKNCLAAVAPSVPENQPVPTPLPTDQPATQPTVVPPVIPEQLPPDPLQPTPQTPPPK